MKQILDVSRYQGTINWDAVKASGLVDGVMLKTVSTNHGLSSRSDGLYIDPYFERNYAECQRVGLPVGTYHYTYALNKEMADAELALVRQALVGKTFGMPCVVDVEENKIKILSTQALTDLTAYQLKTVESWGLYAMLYTYTSFAKSRLYMTGAALKPFDVWLADYTGKTPKVDFPYGMHQYTSKGTVPGISGGVDLSRAYKDYPAIIQRAGLARVRG
ncbi:MAG: GH25 family lysozyme [Faecalibacterium sp.]